MVTTWPFVGRAAEIARIETLAAARVGALLVGEPGVGKSALARHLAARAADAGRPASVLDGRRARKDMPYEPFAAFLTDAVTSATVPVRPSEICARVGRSLPPGVLLIVDDAHLLDERSGEVLALLAEDRGRGLILTANAGRLPAAIDQLWRDGRCERVDVGGLTDADVGVALEAVLGDGVDPRTKAVFAHHSQGNPLLLRELVIAATNESALQRHAGVWALSGAPPLSLGIRDLVADRLFDLDPRLGAGLEVIAAGEPVDARLAADFVDEVVLEDLERARLIAVRGTLGGVEVTTAHPLYGEVLRETMPRLRLRRIRLELAVRIEKAPAPAPHDLVRAALWRLEIGVPSEPDRLVAAARAARTFSLDVAEKLARAAYDASGSPEAAILLGEVLTHANRGDEAIALLARLPPDALSAEDREALAYCQAIGQGLLSGDAGAGADLVAGVLAGVPSASDHLRAVHASLLSFDSRFNEALLLGRPLVEDPGTEAVARTFAGIGVVGSCYWLGCTAEAVRYADLLDPVSWSVRDAVPFGHASMTLMAICALIEAGRVDEAERRALVMRATAADADDSWAGPRAEYVFGRIAMARGQVATARRSFALCIGAITPFDQLSLRHLCSMLARATADGGDPTAARAALDDAADGPLMKPYELEWQLAEAAVLAAQARMDEAAEIAVWVAEVAASLDQWNVAVMAGLDAGRYGAARTSAGPLRTATEHVEGVFAGQCLDYVDALGSRDGVALDHASERFAEHGHLLLAAEAAGQAAIAHAEGGRPRPATASGRSYGQLLTRCEGAALPWLAGAASPVPLTLRERQVAWLAARGGADLEIARDIGVSVRTVQTHLGRVYDKLGVRSRTELPRALN